MVLSNEPGLYRDGEYGIRIENLMIVQPAMSTQFGDFLKFEIITVFLIEKNLIDVNLMANEEITWLNTYHQFVFEKISPFLEEKETAWLKENKHPDIIFMDIKLRDGNCFEIFDKVKIESKIES